MLEQGHPNASKILCHISIFLGSFMAYVFPMIGVADLISNCIVATIFLYYLQHNRQFVYLGVLALSDISIVITVGWLYWFPTFGLPFATAGNTYYFISLTSTTSCKLGLQSISTHRMHIQMTYVFNKPLCAFGVVE
uniref:G_PROTEIN_RECEP_F1_2 domain-containing protein n=1 Tax=Schistosoma mansoni TaxID=6183 RepID=A0A3Q0KIJ8_SCHMA